MLIKNSKKKKNNKPFTKRQTTRNKLIKNANLKYFCIISKKNELKLLNQSVKKILIKRIINKFKRYEALK